MTDKRNEAAFPIVRSREEFVEAFGLTKRELFAAMAMQALCSNGCIAAERVIDFAGFAVSQADALIAELDKDN